MNSKKLAVFLAIVFITVLAVCTVYSRYHYQENWPIVQIGASESFAIHSLLNKDGEVRPADDIVKQKGWSHMVDVTVKAEDYNEDIDMFFMYEGDPVPVSLAEGQKVVGEVARMLYAGDEITVTVGFNGGDIPEGARVNVLFEKQSALSVCSTPIDAIYYDPLDGREFVYLVVRQQNAWGDNEYALVREYVRFNSPKRYKDFYIIKRLDPFEYPIVTRSDGFLYEGAKVRLEE